MRRERPRALLACVTAVLASLALASPGAAASCAGRDGCQEWAVRYDGPTSGGDVAAAVAIHQDTIYVASTSDGGPSQGDYLLLAYDRAGSLRWTARYEGPGTGFDRFDRVGGMALSADGSRVFLTGSSSVAGSPFSDIATVAFDARTGETLWVARHAGAAGRHDQGLAIAAAPGNGTVFVVGMETVTTPTGGLDVDAVALAYDPETGDRLWRTPYAGTRAGQDLLRRVVVAPDGETVYAAGETAVIGAGSFPYDYLTLALDAGTGAPRWDALYNAEGDDYDGAFGLALAPDGNRVFVTGQSRGVAATFSGTDAATVAYDASDGAELWLARYNGSANGFDAARDASVAPDGSAVVVAGVQATQDTGFDYLTAAYHPETGDPLWSAAYTGPADEGTDSGFGLAVSGDEVYVTGTSQNLEVDLDTATVAYDVGTGMERWRATYATPPVGPYRDSPADIAASPDGSQVIVAANGPVEGQDFDVATVAYAAGRDGIPVFDSLSAQLSGDHVEVSGSVSFVEGGVSAAADDPADASVPVREAGAELASATLRYDPSTGSLLVRLGVPELIEETGGNPSVLYGLDLTVDGVGYQVRGGLRADDPGGGASFALFRCQGDCAEVGSLQGSVDAREGAVRATVPLAALGASEGQMIRSLRAFSAMGEVTAGALSELDSIAVPDAAIPSRSVEVGIAPAGAGLEDVPFTPALLSNDGTFSARLDAPEEPGADRLWARACLGVRCVVTSTPL